MTPEEQEKELLKKIKEQTIALLKESALSKEQAEELLNKRMEIVKDLPVEALKGLVDAEKGVMAILKKQGEEITAMKENASKAGGEKENGLKTLIKSLKKDIQALFENKDEAKTIVMNVSKAAAVMTTANTVTGDDALPDQLIESFSEAAFVPKRYPREYVYDLANVTNVAELEKFKTWLEEGSEQGAFAVVAEGGLKPLVSTSLVRNFATARKVAGKYVVTEEFQKFYKNIFTIIKRIISQKMLRDKAAILVTDLLADAAPYTASALDGQFATPNDYQAIAAVAAQIEGLNFVPDMIILNPQDKWRIAVSVDGEGRFFIPNVPVVGPDGSLRLLGFTVRTSNRVSVGNFLLGESGLWEIEQEGITIRMGYGVTVTGGTSNGGGNVTDVQPDIDHNRMRVIVEQYFINYLATNNEGSFVYANFDDVKELLESGGS